MVASGGFFTKTFRSLYPELFMDRRSFLTTWAHNRLARPETVSAVRPMSGLEPFVPSTAQPWDAIRVGHLLRRITFLPRWSDLDALMKMTPSDAVDKLLDTPNAPPPPSMADHSTESLEGLTPDLENQIRGQWIGDAGALRNWYIGVLRDAGLTAAEKMAAFWSGHFTSEFEVDLEYVIGPLLYRQNKLFRDTGLGDFKQLAFNVTLDPAMLVYLGGDLNRAGAPNENYGRELMELFTMGIGHYTEGDVKEAARILTGWRVSQFTDQFIPPTGLFTSYFEAKNHDINAKQFMGVSFPARDSTTNTEHIVRQEEIAKLIETIFQKRPREVARFICRKLYTFFVYSNPAKSDAAVIEAMADIFVQNNFNIKPVMAALLKSAHFYDNANIGAQIKTPMEFEVGLARQLGATGSLYGEMRAMGQDLFDPPNVSGWPGYRDWITTTTYPVRADAARRVIGAMGDNAVLAFIKQFPQYDDVNELVKSLGALLLPRPLSAGRKGIFVKKLVGGAPDYEWAGIVENSPSTAARNMKDLMQTIAELPDFQLC